MPEPTPSELGQAIQEVSERASLLIREEIELAKAEMTEKLTKLIKATLTSPLPPRPTVGEAAATPARQGTVTPARPGSGTGT